MVFPLAGVLAVTTFASTASADHEGREFLVELSPENEVMNVESDAMGTAHFEVSDDGDTLDYWIHAEYLEGATAGHLHSGSADEDGPVELFLFHNDEPMDYNGDIASGTLHADDLVGDLSWEEFSMALVAGDVYANIHTEDYPDGELRGQLDEYAQNAAMEKATMPTEMPQTGMGGSSSGNWFTSLWKNITGFLFS
ncbi:CHRD domain-containing protein [Geomicrobium sp. JCM 19055]|uniref:CHRD domain-containing protein n=1 Tax=Geomicrobium sp. JCM 19055 TaxID=1460649 RepID=UPI00045ED4D1|nr:CHRD domain-containing protein [Geomicrobium sp. JCM 19055]GAJ99717.1 hypothetical protein JCM19055_2745 [Geomicrobium sp. JCM 19055]